MNILFKIAVITIIYIVLSIIIKPHQPEYVFFLRLIAVILIFSLITDYISEFISNLLSVFSVFNIESVHISLLIKVIGVSLVSDFVSDTLKDNGETAMSDIVILASKFIILFLSMPLLNSLIIFCLKIIE